jgi:hypothetical protein
VTAAIRDEHPDTVLVDMLTAYLNTEHEPSGADIADLVCQLITGSGRPLLAERWELTADVLEDRHGLLTATLTAGAYTIRVGQTTDRTGDLTVAITSADTAADRDDYGLAITVDDRPILDPMPMTWNSSVPSDLQWTTQKRDSMPAPVAPGQQEAHA